MKFSEKNVAKSCEGEALGGAIGRAGMGERCSREFLFSKQVRVGDGFKYEV